MNTAKFSFTILQYSGVWRPKSLTSHWTILLYNFYSSLIVIAFITLVSSLLLYILLVRTDIESLMENIMVFVGIFGLNLKVIYVLLRRNDIIRFDDLFLEAHCSPRDSDESDIQTKIHNSNRLNSIRFLTGCYIYFTFNFIILSFLSKDVNNALPMKAWVPYKINSRLKFWITYLHETSVMMIMINAQVALDGLAIGMMQQICGQLDIIRHRLHQIDNLKQKRHVVDLNLQFAILKECMFHHSYVYLIGKQLNNIIGWLAFLMFLATIIALCAVIYQLSAKSPVSVNFWSSFAASNSLLFEIFLYCWYGQELIEKSTGIADAAYEIDWTNLPIKSKKYLFFIILRATKPIELSGLSVVTMSVETFLKISQPMEVNFAYEVSSVVVDGELQLKKLSSSAGKGEHASALIFKKGLKKTNKLALLHFSIYLQYSMNTAKFSFTILQYSGVWRPKSFSSKWKILLYNFYSSFVVLIFGTLVISLFLYIILIQTDIESFMENVMVFVAVTGLNFKTLYVLLRRDDIIRFDDMFSENHCAPRDPYEFRIQKNIDNSNRLNSIRFLAGCFVYFIINFLMLSFVTQDMNKMLPIKIWVPYVINSRLKFWITYLHETSVMIIMINTQVALDGLTIGMMQKICEQLDIITHRLSQINNIEQKNYDLDLIGAKCLLKECLYHHSYVYLLGKKLNNILSWLAFIMFLETIITLCTIIYQLSSRSMISMKFWSTFAASNSLLFEIFLYCWYGQEMIEKSLNIGDIVYQLDWTRLQNSSKKYLVLIILRSSKPIELRGLNVITMSLQTFLKILKVSYSTFNLIQSL